MFLLYDHLQVEIYMYNRLYIYIYTIYNSSHLINTATVTILTITEPVIIVIRNP
jgi:hypothetical protein